MITKERLAWIENRIWRGDNLDNNRDMIDGLIDEIERLQKIEEALVSWMKAKKDLLDSGELTDDASREEEEILYLLEAISEGKCPRTGPMG